MKILLLPFCGDGIRCSFGVAEKRIDAAVAFVAGLSGQKFCVLPSQMQGYLLGKHGCNFETSRGDAGWGTLHEMVEAIKAARKWGFTSEDFIVVCSSEDHMLRIEEYARWVMPKTWWIEHVTIDHYLNEPMKEWLKYQKDLPKLFWYSAKVALGFPL